MHTVKFHLQLPKASTWAQEPLLVVFISLLSILAPQDTAQPSDTKNEFLFSTQRKNNDLLPKSTAACESSHAHRWTRSRALKSSEKRRLHSFFSPHKRQHLRRDDFFPADEFCIGDGLAVPFEHHDGLLSVAEVVVVNTVIWRRGREGERNLITWEGCTGHGIIAIKILPAASTSHFKPHLG